MPSASGKIDKITLHADYCLFSLDTGGTYFFWSYIVGDDDAKSRIIHGQFLAMARSAFQNGTDCTITYPSGSSIIDTLILE